jgi:hypothetical protein
MKKYCLLLIGCLVHMILSARDPVSAGNYGKFQSSILVGRLYTKKGEAGLAMENYNLTLNKLDNNKIK